ncbi:MAG: sulfatase [Planctomycetes bacterium]|nr:sulfatase [Planctomycetota bacterium]
MERRDFLKTCVAAAAGGVMLSNREMKVKVGPRPNILFVLVDDQRNDTLGCAGHPFIQTPNIDQLARNGVRFENMFVSTSICMASRACIFTGLTERSHGYTGGGSPVISKDIDTSFPVLLRKEGYRTGFFGKQHVRFVNGDGEMDRMFDTHEVIFRNPYFKEQPDGSLRHTAELIGDRSIEFLESQPDDKPFFLYMSFNISHAEDKDKEPGIGHFPWPKAEDGMYENIQPSEPDLSAPEYFDCQPDFMKESTNRERFFWRWDTPEKYATNMRAYYRMLTGMDRIVGRVTKALEENGMADNTIVIYSADNGYYMGNRGFAGKWTHFDESLRVPLIIYDPRMPKNNRNRVAQPMALNLDITSTILDECGIEEPSKYQGRSLVPILNGKTPSSWRKDVYNEHHKDKQPKWYGVRGQRYTYANYYEENTELLYDLETDPTQLHNLADKPEHKAVLAEMRDRSLEYVEMYTRPEIEEHKKRWELQKAK